MNTKHTPGPWVLDDIAHSHVDADYHIIDAGKGYHLDGEGSDGFNLSGCMSLDDARLIAAAPDLLAALESLALVVGLTAFKHESQRAVLQEAVDLASAAIAKAKGEA
jgi:hypothetical protein